MNTALKKAAMEKARKEGWTLSAMINFATRAYIKGSLSIEMLDPELSRGLDDIRHGRVISLEEAERRLSERLKEN